MILNSHDKEYLLELATNAAIEAGRIIQSVSKDFKRINPKAGGSSLAANIVTQADLLSERFIMATLGHTFSMFDLGVLSEETPDDGSRHIKEFFWCIDPLDGTLAYSQDKPGYAVSIALVSQSGIPELGVVYDPINDDLYSAIKGQGAFLNSAPFEMKHAWLHDEDLVINGDKSLFEHAKFRVFEEEVNQLAVAAGFRSVSFRCAGGAVMNAIMSLLEPFGAYLKQPKSSVGGGSLWDFAATACIYSAAGAQITDAFGSPLKLNRQDTLFMNGTGVCFATNKKISNLMQSINTLKNN